jgi:hypothetical protein
MTTVPSFVSSGCLDAFSCEVGRCADTRGLTSECERIQAALRR